MTQKVLIHKNILTNLSACLKNVEFEFGLISGQSLDSSSVSGQSVEHYCPISPPDDRDAPSSIHDVDANDAVNHAHQVSRMLPGGIDVIGVYIAWPSATNNTSESARVTKLRTMVTAIYKTAVFSLSKLPKKMPTMVVMTFCSSSLQYTCQRYSVTATAALPETVAVVVEQGSASPWLELSFSYHLDLQRVVAPQQQRRGKEGASLHAMLVEELEPWSAHVSSSLVLVNGVLCRLDDTTPLKEKVSMKDGSGPLSCRVLERCQPAANSRPAITEAATAITLAGTMAGRAVVRDTCSVGAAVSAVLSDVCRSASVRWSLHCDSLLQEDTASAAAAVLHELPRRVLIDVPGLRIPLCDYLFPGDTAEDACASARDLLGLTAVTPQDVLTRLEAPHSLSESEYSSGSSSAGCSSSSSRSSLVLRPRHLQAAATIALLAILMAYLYLSRS